MTSSSITQVRTEETATGSYSVTQVTPSVSLTALRGHSAGMPSVLDWTDDGHSMCFGVNHLGHFLLTNLLLPRLKESAPSRVITLTCSSYKYQKLDFQDLNYNLLPFFTYCRSKLANVYFSHELARITDGKGVSCYAVHPGE